MPDIKRNFASGKMNKDVDERLVPNGEYRDALNIQVSTSDSSDIGSIQNILGNARLNGQTNITPGSICIGSISDEKNDCFYWFITESAFISAYSNTSLASVVNGQTQQGKLTWTNDPGNDIFGNPILGQLVKQFSGFSLYKERISGIYKFTKRESPAFSYDYKIDPVVIDKNGVIITSWESDGDNGFSVGQLGLAVNISGGNLTSSDFSSGFLSNGSGFGFGSNNGPVSGVNTGKQLEIYVGENIKIGDSIKGIGFNPWTHEHQNFFPEDCHVQDIHNVSTWIDVDGITHKRVVVTCSHNVSTSWWNGVDNVWQDTFIDPFNGALGFPITELVTQFVFGEEGILHFDENTVVTGINIIDDLLFWTDGKSEPKKINIPRCIEGTDPSGQIKTKFISHNLDIKIDDDIPLEEKHITVIRKSPKSPPLVSITSDKDRSVENFAGIITTVEPGSSIVPSFIGPDLGIENFNTGGFEIGDTFCVKIGTDLTGQVASYFNIPNLKNNAKWSWEVGTKVVLKECDTLDGVTLPSNLQDFRIKGVIVGWGGGTQQNINPEIGNNFQITTPPTVWDSSTNREGGSIRVKIQITNINGSIPSVDVNVGRLDWVIDTFDDTEKLFEFKFPRFATRYKYEDGEYSRFSPFTDVVFKPGGF